MTQKVIETNIRYGGLKPQVTNVIFIHGSIDPWHALGLTNLSNATFPSIFINGTSHCADMYQPNANDSMDLSIARDRINDLIGIILN